MRKYRVIDLQGGSFMSDTFDQPETLNSLRARFWSLDEARTTHYKHFTADYIQETWGIEFERI